MYIKILKQQTKPEHQAWMMNLDGVNTDLYNECPNILHSIYNKDDWYKWLIDNKVTFKLVRTYTKTSIKNYDNNSSDVYYDMNGLEIYDIVSKRIPIVYIMIVIEDIEDAVYFKIVWGNIKNGI